MPTDSHAPDLSLNVRYSRGDNGEKEETNVEILENEVTLEHSCSDLESHGVSEYKIITKYYTRKTYMFVHVSLNPDQSLLIPFNICTNE